MVAVGGVIVGGAGCRDVESEWSGLGFRSESVGGVDRVHLVFAQCGENRVLPTDSIAGIHVRSTQAAAGPQAPADLWAVRSSRPRRVDDVAIGLVPPGFTERIALDDDLPDVLRVVVDAFAIPEDRHVSFDVDLRVSEVPSNGRVLHNGVELTPREFERAACSMSSTVGEDPWDGEAFLGAALLVLVVAGVGGTATTLAMLAVLRAVVRRRWSSEVSEGAVNRRRR